ncbi:hypothetical protein BRETT_000562 [Brettanomyces bruxellensis]|uniref:Uncharacterized protein n=1 Tax=Dekkera bruxellensis TaxID=5007 RepID=A0A871RAN0_DEKBR|nr:uncharacterized protein BRETT_000562 [Brettanomyces bruxellensis]QOU20848.1 hypothetical protein BRETT_000562 [Brettanomyces bruxellensis]
MAETFESLREQGNRKFRQENYTGSLICYTRCIDLQPSAFALYCNRAAALIKLDSMDEAEDDLRKSLIINPEYVPSLLRLGFLMLYKGNVVESLKNYVQAVRVSSRHPHQLDRFKSRLKEAVRLTESRARQQGYSQDYIDGIIADDVRITLDGYSSIRHETGGNSDIPAVYRSVNPTTSFAEDGNTQGRNIAGNGAGIAAEFPLFQQTTTGGNENGANANPRIVQGPNGFSASFTVGPNQANGLMGLISRITGQPLDNNADQPNHPTTPQASTQNNVSEADSTHPVASAQNAPDPDVGIPDVQAGDYSGSSNTTARSNIPNFAQQINNTAQAFIQGRANNGQPLNGADMARGLATTIASQIGHALSNQAQNHTAQVNASGNPNDMSSQLRGIAQAAATAFLGSMTPNNGNNAGANAATTANTSSNAANNATSTNAATSANAAASANAATSMNAITSANTSTSANTPNISTNTFSSTTGNDTDANPAAPQNVPQNISARPTNGHNAGGNTSASSAHNENAYNTSDLESAMDLDLD